MLCTELADGGFGGGLAGAAPGGAFIGGIVGGGIVGGGVVDAPLDGGLAGGGFGGAGPGGGGLGDDGLVEADPGSGGFAGAGPPGGGFGGGRLVGTGPDGGAVITGGGADDPDPRDVGSGIAGRGFEVGVTGDTPGTCALVGGASSARATHGDTAIIMITTKANRFIEVPGTRKRSAPTGR
jgi:hypothetical protein